MENESCWENELRTLNTSDGRSVLCILCPIDYYDNDEISYTGLKNLLSQSDVARRPYMLMDATHIHLRERTTNSGSTCQLQCASPTITRVGLTSSFIIQGSRCLYQEGSAYSKSMLYCIHIALVTLLDETWLLWPLLCRFAIFHGSRGLRVTPLT